MKKLTKKQIDLQIWSQINSLIVSQIDTQIWLQIIHKLRNQIDEIDDIIYLHIQNQIKEI